MVAGLILGFLLSGIGLALNIVSIRVSILLVEGTEGAMEKCFSPLWDTVFLLVLLWLSFAWFRSPSEPGRRPHPERTAEAR